MCHYKPVLLPWKILIPVTCSAIALRFHRMDCLSQTDHTSNAIADFDALVKDIKTFIGISGRLSLFLDHSGWVCSIDMDNATQKSLIRHFFIPFQLQGTTGHILILVTSYGSVVLAVDDELAVFHNGLTFEEHVDFEGKPLVSSKPSMRSNLKRFSSAPT